jgi:acyl-CoA synthetase (AMP-forming)/AMP-acid ligase II
VFVHDILARAAGAAPEAPALYCGDASWTFADLDADAAALAAAVAARTEAGDRVAILSHSRGEYVTAYYGVPRAGRVLVPLNPRLHPAEWADQLARSGARLLLAEPDLLAAARAHGGTEAHPPLRGAAPPATVCFDDPSWRALLDEGRGLPAPAGPAAGTEPAWLLFTSGSTGRPKGVRLTHRSLTAAVRTSLASRPVAGDAVFLTPFPLCHVAGYNVLTHHHRARPVVLLPRWDPAALVALTRRHGVTGLSLAPTMIDALLDHLDAAGPKVTARVRSGVRAIGYGSSPIGADLLRRVQDVLGCELNQGYGMTELSGNAFFLGPDDHRAAAAGRPHLLAAAGRPGPGVELRIVDDAWADVPAGTVGEVAVRAEQSADGYWDDPEATAAAWRDGWFRTGDLGRVDDEGYLYLVDRKKDVIVSGGENVSAREVEAVLRADPAVREVAVIGLPDPRWGERVCAVVVPGLPLDEAELTERLVARARGALAGFKVPRRVFVTDELPVTGTGKVSKGALRERYSAAAEPAADRPAGG